ncbi:MAG: TlyA family RNA methyltransferase, partial [Actinomycetia bacterium]|nr:TlyA family RNA methyltransferase [Actinomycetes bacterium]
MKKRRLDSLLVKKSFYKSREKAKRAILAGDVFVNGQRADKVGILLKGDEDISVKNPPKYVSRGGYKIEKAINSFKVKISNKVCLDCGASTGGFTDCLLKNGAKKVYAIDVGYGQFDWGLRNNRKVVLFERKNIKDLKVKELKEKPEIVVVDVSFISIGKIWDNLKKLSSDVCEYIFLIKPQFEVGKGFVGKNGIVRDRSLHKDVLMKLCKMFKADNYQIKLTYSP